jgi:hypothetical protein
MHITNLNFGSLQEAWEGINEYMAQEEKLITKRGGGVYGPELISYNNLVKATRAWVDPEFDFGKIFGYTNKKWSSLVNNYVEFNYLEMIRAEINLRRNRSARSYNFAYHFANHHGSGKDCLLALNFMKRLNVDHPIVLFTVRTSEVTRRLIFDFLLVQRIVEYVYGHNDVEIQIYLPSMFIHAESFIMYNNHKSIKKLMKPYMGDLQLYQKRIISKLDEFMNIDVTTIKYKVHLRAAKQLQKDKDGQSISGRQSLKAKDLVLRKPISNE